MSSVIKIPDDHNEIDEYKLNKKVHSIIHKPNEFDINNKKIVLNKRERRLNIIKDENV